MIWFDMVQQTTAWMADASSLSDSWHSLALHFPLGDMDWSLLAQQFDTDPLAGARGAFSKFFESGQAWAFLAGIVLGYLLRSFTSYG